MELFDTWYKIIINTSAVSSINLGAILIFASCVNTPAALVYKCIILGIYIYNTYGCCQGEHQQPSVVNDNGRYYSYIIICHDS